MRGLHLKLNNIFEILHIRDSAFVAANIKLNPFNILDGINFDENGDEYEKRDKVDISKLKIIDENKVKKVTVNFKSIPFEFEFYHKKDSTFYHLYTGDTKSPGECLLIIINKINGSCVINNVTTFDKCFPVYVGKKDKTGKNDFIKSFLTLESIIFPIDSTGSLLLKLALQLIKKLKDHYKLTKVFLTDNSMKICKNHRIELHKMLTLLTGTTWYGKHEFIPVKKEHYKEFKENKQIMNKLLLKDIPKLRTYIIEAHTKAKSKENIDMILINYDEALNRNALLSNYLKYFLHDYDNSCDIFYYFYNKLYTKLGLNDMGGREFYLKL